MPIWALLVGAMVLSAGTAHADERLRIDAHGRAEASAADVHDGLVYAATQRVKVVCPAGGDYVVKARITQASGARSIAANHGFTCTGHPQHLEMRLSLGPSASSAPIQLGQDATRSLALVSLVGGPGAEDLDTTRVIIDRH